MALALCLICQYANAKIIDIATGEFPPWTGAKLAGDGCVNSIVREAFANEGIEVRFTYLPWKRAFEEAKHGRYDATSYWYTNQERELSMRLSDPLIQNRTVFFQRKAMAPVSWQSLDDLSGYSMSATLGFTYTKSFYEAVNAGILKPIMVPTDIQNLKMLMSGRIDIFATDEMSGLYMAKSLNIDAAKLRVIEPELAKANGYLMAAKSNPHSEELIESFNRGLRKLKASGRYQQIIGSINYPYASGNNAHSKPKTHTGIAPARASIAQKATP